MIVKEADDRSVEIQKLREWSQDARIPESVRERIRNDLTRRQSGVAGEEGSAYQIDFHFGPSANWAVIHDLRLEVNGRVAQIDHLLINRFLECFVLETKHYAAGVSVNDRDEFTCHYPGKSFGIESPDEQNKRHMAVLREAFDSGLVELPKRLGFTLKPTLTSVLLFSPKARITLAPGCADRWRHLIKSDALRSWVDKRADAENPILTLGSAAKIVSPETVEALARGIAALHQPVVFNPYELVARYGLSAFLGAPAPAMPGVECVREGAPCCLGCGAEVEAKVVAFCRLPQQVAKFGGKILCRACQVTPVAKPVTPPAAAAVSKPVAKVAGPACAACGAGVDDKVAFFCRLPKNKDRFGGRVLCRACQPA